MTRLGFYASASREPALVAVAALVAAAAPGVSVVWRRDILLTSDNREPFGAVVVLDTSVGAASIGAVYRDVEVPVFALPAVELAAIADDAAALAQHPAVFALVATFAPVQAVKHATEPPAVPENPSVPVTADTPDTLDGDAPAPPAAEPVGDDHSTPATPVVTTPDADPAASARPRGKGRKK